MNILLRHIGAAPPRYRLPPVMLTLSLVVIGHVLLGAVGPASLPGDVARALVSAILVSVGLRHLLMQARMAEAARASALWLLLPGVMLASQPNVGGLPLWIAPALMCIGDAIGRRHAAMLGWLALATLIDTHALIIAPFVGAVLLQGNRVNLRLVAALVAVVIWGLVRHVLSIDVMRADMSVAWPAAPVVLADFAPNIWSMAAMISPFPAQQLLGLAIAATIGCAAAFIARFSVRSSGTASLLSAAQLSALAMPLVSPGMNPSDFALAAIMVPVPLLFANRRLPIWPAVGVQLGVAFAILAQLANSPAMAAAAAIMMITVTLSQLRETLFPAANDNPLLVRPC